VLPAESRADIMLLLVVVPPFRARPAVDDFVGVGLRPVAATAWAKFVATACVVVTL